MKIALFNSGFRLFFFLASTFAVVSIALWSVYYAGLFTPATSVVNPFYWHAHEMVYGYAMAVIAGFLLTAVKNWTGIITLERTPLALLGCLWLAARLCFSLGSIVAAWVFDVMFISLLATAITLPVIKVRQWKQMAVLSKIVLLLLLNCLFYLGALGYLESGMYLGIYGGLYLIVGLVLMMARRLFPFFVQAATRGQMELPNSILLDRFILGAFLGFYIAELVVNYRWSGFFSLLLFLACGWRLLRWHFRVIWQSPLLWVLYLSLWFINSGFLLFWLSNFLPVSRFVALHAITYGGLGLITLGMMARVSLGHSGRDIYNPPAVLWLICLLLTSGAVVRVFLPIAFPVHYPMWIWASQLLWMGSFTLFTLRYVSMFFLPRIDAKPG